jgi:hypothetical protein
MHDKSNTKSLRILAKCCFYIVTMDRKVMLDVQISTKTLQKNTYVKVIDFASDYRVCFESVVAVVF